MIWKVLLAFLLISFCLGKRLFAFFIRQSKQPFGKIGSFLVGIWNRTFDDMTNWGLANYELKSDLIILDVGCGGGRTIQKFTTCVPTGKIVGIDISQTALGVAHKVNRMAIEAGLVQLEVANVANLDFTKESFELVTAIQTFMYWDEVEAGFRELYRILKRKGSLVVVTEKYKIHYHKKEYEDVSRFMALLKSLGFDIVEIKETNKWVSVHAVK